MWCLLSGCLVLDGFVLIFGVVFCYMGRLSWLVVEVLSVDLIYLS